MLYLGVHVKKFNALVSEWLVANFVGQDDQSNDNTLKEKRMLPMNIMSVKVVFTDIRISSEYFSISIDFLKTDACVSYLLHGFVPYLHSQDWSRAETSA